MHLTAACQEVSFLFYLIEQFIANPHVRLVLLFLLLFIKEAWYENRHFKTTHFYLYALTENQE